MTYLLTVACFGTHLPGDRLGVVNHKRNRIGDPYVGINSGLANSVRQAMRQTTYCLDISRAQYVLDASLSLCHFRGWHAHAIHVRTTHFHAVLTANEKPERILIEMKAYASRRLNQAGSEPSGIVRWARHGSTRYLWDEGSVAAAIRYVIDAQGSPMALYLNQVASASPPLRSGFC